MQLPPLQATQYIAIKMGGLAVSFLFAACLEAQSAPKCSIFLVVLLSSLTREEYLGVRGPDTVVACGGLTQTAFLARHFIIGSSW